MAEYLETGWSVWSCFGILKSRAKVYSRCVDLQRELEGVKSERMRAIRRRRRATLVCLKLRYLDLTSTQNDQRELGVHRDLLSNSSFFRYRQQSADR